MNQHNPKKLSNIISNFSRNNNIIKFTTHSWDFGQGERTFNTLEEFINQVKEEWNKYSKEIKELKPTLYEKYESFLFNKNNKSWGLNNIEIGWSSKELTGNEEDPHSIVLPREYRKDIDNKSMDRFSDVIELFELETKLRSYDKSHKRLIRKAIRSNGYKYTTKFVNNEDIYISTDTQEFYEGLSAIVSTLPIKENEEKAQIQVKIERDSEKGTVDFIFSLKEIEVIKTESEIENDIKSAKYEKIKNSLNSVCDWKVKVKTNQGIKTHQILGNIEDKKSIQEVESIIHILRFYI